jgi:ankyrin repeat protein
MLNMSRRHLRFCCLLLAGWLWLGAGRAATPAEVSDFFRAVTLDDARTVEAMLAGTMSPNAIDPLGGEPALVLSMREGSMRVFKVLLAHPETRIELNASNGNTALMMAAFKHNAPAVQTLLAKGAIVNRPGWTALHYAAASGDDEIARILLEHHAVIDAEAPGKLTPLMIAAREGKESTAQFLMEQGADASLKSGEGLTAARIATRADKPRIAAAIAQHLAGRK